MKKQDITTRRASADKMVHDFRQAFYTRFGIMPKVIYNIDSMSRNVYSLEAMEKFANELLWERYPGKYPKGIKQNNGERDLTTYKFMFCYIAKDVGWTNNAIANFLGYKNHASTIHNTVQVEALLEQRDMETLILHSDFLTRLKALNKENSTNEDKTSSVS